ncbi:MAG: hypothetical protein LBV42_01945 [Methanobrevibacter sp.]|nr:hypothetical protein [Methanobrevibacter sp.]
MFKKFFGVLLLTLIVMSSVSSVIAADNTYDCPIELGDTFTKREICNRFDMMIVWF